METLYNLHDPVLEPRLRNWAKWCRSPASPYPIRCVGPESKYRSPQVWYPETPAEFIDELDAHLVEDCVVSMPKSARTALKLWHVLRLDPRWIAKRVNSRDIALTMRQTCNELYYKLKLDKQDLMS